MVLNDTCCPFDLQIPGGMMCIQIVGSKSGFTLVEIGIVLVIVGLLLGGILKGQELINSARMRNLADTSADT